MSEALISVIVPVYKVEPCLDRCVQSILDQDHGQFELLLIDDGSPDRCGAMCEEWAKRDSRVRVFHKENGGQSSARNMGLDHARGRYIAFVDSDDWVTPDYLSYMLSLFPDEPGCRFTACNHLILRGRRRQKACDIGCDRLVLTRNQAYEAVLFHGCMDVSPWGKLYARDMFDGLRFPNQRLFEDTWLFGDLLDRTEYVVFGNKPCYYYEIRQGSTVHQAFRKKNLEYIEAAERLAALAVAEDQRFAVGGTRRVNHARLSVLRYMERCDDVYKPLRRQLRREILEAAPAYINDPRTPKRDRIAVALLRLGLKPFYAGWSVYTRFR